MIIEIWVKPGSKRGDLVIPGDGKTPWTVFVAAKPVDGDANASVVKLLAAHFGVPSRKVSIKSGHTSRRKFILIEQTE